MGNSSRPFVSIIVVVMLISSVLLSTCYIQLGRSASASIIINDGDSHTSSTSVTLTLSTDVPFLMHFSNTGVFSDVDWEDFASTKDWTLTSGDGTKTVYVQFKDQFDAISEASDTIILDTSLPSLTINSPVSGSWFNTLSVPVSGTASDAGSGISMVEYRLNTGTWTLATGTESWSFTATFGTQGSRTISVRATDFLDNIVTETIDVNIDTVAPSSLVSSLSTYQTSTSFNVFYTSSDASSGVDSVNLWVQTPGSASYVDLGPWVSGDPYTASAGAGLYEFYSTATDNAGNVEAPPVSPPDASTNIEAQAPITNIDLSGTLGSNDWYTSVVTVTLSADDGVGSGVKEIHYVLDGVENVVLSDSAVFDVDTTGIHSLSYWAVDNSGNVETAHDTTVKVDLSVLTTSVDLSGDLLEGESDWYVGPVTVTLNTDGAGSEISTYYSLNGGESYELYAGPFTVTSQGTTLLYYYSTSAAGATETPNTTAVNIAYSVTFTASGLPAGTSWSATLGDTQQSSTGSTITILSKTGEQSWSVTDAISGPAGTRYFESDSQGVLDVQSDSSVDVSYVTQFSFTVASAYGSPTGAGWYDSGSTVDFGVSSPVSGGTGVRYVFTMWTGDSSSTSPIGVMVMNGPKAVTANWQTQYQLTFVVSPQVGGTTSPSGSVWVNAGADRSISATAASSNYQFNTWTASAGTISSPTSLSTSIKVTGPSTVTATFDQVQGQEPTPTPAPSSNPTTSPTRTPTVTSKPTVQPTPTPTPAATEVPSDFVTASVLTSISDGSSTHISMYGNVDGSDISGATLNLDQTNAKSTLSLTLIGESGSNSFCNVTIPKRAVTYGTVPTVYINNQVVSNQGYMEDSNYYYVWFNTYLSTYDLSVVFEGQSFPVWPVGVVIGVSLVLVAGVLTPRLRHKGDSSLRSKKEFTVTDYEISDGVLKFYNSSGVRGKPRVPVREIPISKIISIEHFWNEITISWNEFIDTFHKKGDFEAFNEAVTSKVQAIMDENQKALERAEKSRLRNSSVQGVITDALPVVDVVFDILRALHAKRVDWSDIENIGAILGQSMNLSAEALPPLSLDFTNLSSAISMQDPREVAGEARNILKSVHQYFNNLKQIDDVADVRPNLADVSAMVNSYFMLNDVMLGKIVGQKENPREMHSLERQLQKLSKEANFNVTLDELTGNFDNWDVEADFEDAVGDARDLFKDKISQAYSAE